MVVFTSNITWAWAFFWREVKLLTNFLIHIFIFSISSCISFGHLYLFRNFPILSKPLHGAVFEGAAPPSLAAEPGGHSWAALPCPAEAHSRSGAGSPGSLACTPGRVLSSSVQSLSPQKTVGPVEGAPPPAPSLQGASDNTVPALLTAPPREGWAQTLTAHPQPGQGGEKPAASGLSPRAWLLGAASHLEKSTGRLPLLL